MGRVRLCLLTLAAFFLEALVLCWFPLAGVRPRVLPPLAYLIGVEQGPDRGAACGLLGGAFCYLAGATPWQMALLALVGGFSGLVFHKAGSFWGKWLACFAALAGMEGLLVLGHGVAGETLLAGVRIAGPELLLAGGCFPLAFLLTRIRGRHGRRRRRRR